jgi:hypothetical protein
MNKDVLLKNFASKIDPVNPWEDDALDRKSVAEKLTNIVSSTSQPFVIGLNAAYGTGKTYFFERWKFDLENRGHTVVHFDAWRTDFADDPLIAFMSALKKQFEAEGIDEKNDDLLGMLKTAGGYLARRALPVAARVATAGLLEENAIKEIMDFDGSVDNEIAKMFGEIAREQLNGHQANIQTMSDFQSYLAGISQSIADESEKKTGKIIVLVDELDRCRPTYAIELLENIKHLFSIENYVFVLGVDIDQLKSCVAVIYGADFDSDGYLLRFIDWKFRLPMQNSGNFSSSLFRRYRLDEMANGNDARKLEETLTGASNLMVRIYSPSLRVQERCYTQINIAMRGSAGLWINLIRPLTIIVFLKECDERALERLTDRGVSISDFCDSLPTRIGSRDYDSLFLIIAICKPYELDELRNEATTINLELAGIKESSEGEELNERGQELESRMGILEQASQSLNSFQFNIDYPDGRKSIAGFIMEIIEDLKLISD